MRADEFIVEKIDLSSDHHQKITDIVNKWGTWINSTMDDQNINDTEFHHTISNQLVKYLQPTAKKIINQNISPSFMPDDDYEGHKLKIEVVVESQSSIKGGMYSKWSKLYTKKPKYILYNKILLSISPQELSQVIKGSEKYIIDFASTIAHELTHVIQSLRSTLQGTYTKPYTKQPITDEDVRYFISKIESESYAEGTLFKIISKAKLSGDPELYITKTVLQPLRMGIATLFNKELFPSQDYEKMKAVLKSKSDSPKIEYAKQQAWKRFNKKLYEKLMKYLDK